MTRIRTLAAALAATLLLAACGSSSMTARPATTSTRPPITANPQIISVATKMICGDEGSEDIKGALGTATTQPLTPTWNDHVYSCRYVYPKGVMRLSVKQLGDTAATSSYFQSLATHLGTRTKLSGLGEGAFTTTNHSVVVRKDNKVLVVDVHELPAMFGTPPDTRANAAITVAATIMGCWTGE